MRTLAKERAQPETNVHHPLVKILARFEEPSLQSKRAKRRLSPDFGFDAGGCRSRRALRRGGV